METEAGQEYWAAMNLMGRFASANHEIIHKNVTKLAGAQSLATIENHHNFAWKEKDVDGNQIIVHRKGATPAGEGVLGIIPGSMTAPGFIVRGKGNHESINSASHGAGRQMSRSRAKSSIKRSDMNDLLGKVGVEVIGSGLDEAPQAYKDIHQVMEHQKDLVDVIGKFQPKLVRMCGDKELRKIDS
jgi:tRNA-splicing ligase RtcB